MVLLKAHPRQAVARHQLTPVRCGDRPHKVRIMPSKYLKITRKPWHRALSLPWRPIVQVRVKGPPIVHLLTSLAIRSMEASLHRKTQVASRLLRIFPTPSTCRRKKMQIHQKAKQMLERATALVLHRVNIRRLNRSSPPLPSTSIRIGSLKTVSRTRRLSWS